MNIDEIIENVLGEEFESTNKDIYKNIITFLKKLNEEFILVEEGITLDVLGKVLNKKEKINLKINYTKNTLKTTYVFKKLNNLIINNLPRSIKSMTIPVDFVSNNLEALKEFKSLEEISFNSYRFLTSEELKFLSENTSIKRINFGGYIFNIEDYKGSIFVSTSNDNKILFDDIVINNNKENSNIKENTLEVKSINNFNIEDLDKVFPYIKSDINKVKIKSNTGEYSIDISGKDISIEVTDPDMNISAYLFNYFKNKGYNVNDVCFCLTDFMRNPVVKDYTDFDYSLLDSLSTLVNLKVNYEGNTKTSSYDDFKGLVMSMKWYRSLLNDYDLSPVEKLAFGYDIMKTFEYKEATNEDVFESREPYKIIKTGNIVCVGYTNMLAAILKGTEGISFTDFSVSCYKEDDKTLSGYHSRGLVKVDDDKYDIHGVYVVDPTWDSYKKNGNKRLGNDYTALDLYTYFLISPEDYKKVFPHDSVPNFFKKDYEYLNLNMDNLDSYNELSDKDFTDKDLFTFNFKELFDSSVSNERKLEYLKGKKLDKKTIMEIVRNTRLAEGFSKENVDKEMDKILEYYNKLSNLEIDSLTGKIK